ncbi:hypothetical protein D3C79_947320 [compost metagenome]
MLLLAEIIDNPVFVQTADGHLYDLFAVRHNNVLFGNKVGQIILNGFPDLLLMTLLILMAFTVKGPVFFRYDKCIWTG